MAFTYAGRFIEAIIQTGVANAPVSVFNTGTTNYATIYTTRTKGATVAQPGLTTDSAGNLSFYADPGEYDVAVTVGGVQQPAVKVQVYPDPEDIGDFGDVVHLSGNETIAGVKTFSSAPVVPDSSFAQVKVVNLVTDLAGKVAKGALVINAKDAPYNAVGDGVADDTAAIQAAINAAEAALSAGTGPFTTCDCLLPPGEYKAGGLVLPGRVHLRGNGARLTANAAGPLITINNDYGRVSQLQLYGGGLAMGASGIVTTAGARMNRISEVRFDAFAGRALFFGSGTGSTSNGAEWLFAQNCLLDTASLTTYTGVVEIAGTDNWFRSSEITASRTSLSSANAYADALVITGANTFVSDIQAEISDMGVYVAASELHMVNVRADLNRGHGFYFASGGGTVVGCEALNNGQDANDTYDGFVGITGQFLFDACLARSTTTNKHKFGFRDTQVSASSFNTYGPTCRSQFAVTAPFSVASSSGARIVQASGSPSAIPASATTFDLGTLGWPVSTFTFNNTSALNFTNWTNGAPGQRITVRGDGFTTLVESATIKTTAGANLLLASQKVYSFTNMFGVWYQN